MGYCDWWWYNPGQAPPPCSGSVMINKLDCPPGYDAANASIYDLAATCHGQGQYDFSLTDANGGNQSGTTPGGGLNTVSFSNVPSGALTISEDAPGDYLPPRVFCKNQKITGEEDPEDEVQVNNFAINPTLKQGYDNLYCDWFNVPSPDKVNITITKYECPDGFTSSDPSQLTSSCTESYAPVTFKLDGASSGNPGDQDTGSVIQNGVQWTNMDADTWYITEFLPQGHNEPIVFCSVTDYANNSNTSPQQQTLEQVQDGYRLTYDAERRDRPLLRLVQHQGHADDHDRDDLDPQVRLPGGVRHELGSAALEPVLHDDRPERDLHDLLGRDKRRAAAERHRPDLGAARPGRLHGHGDPAERLERERRLLRERDGRHPRQL